MIYVRNHAERAYIKRVCSSCSAEQANESITLLVLDPDLTIYHKRHPEIRAYVGGDVVCIGREQGKDIIITTVELKKHTNTINWWER